MKPKEIQELLRPDGRPEAYDVPATFRGECVICAQEGKSDVLLSRNEVFMMSPSYWEDNEAHFMCRGHLPENTVIFDPVSGTCRDKPGHNVWRETDPNDQPTIDAAQAKRDRKAEKLKGH
jgi:hypothetical protein